MLALRRFNRAGIDRFAAALDQIRVVGDADVDSLTLDDTLTEMIDVSGTVTVVEFESRYDAGRYFFELLEGLELTTDSERDSGLWSWLSAVWLNKLAPLRAGRRNVGATARWILDVENYQRYYRHLLAGPYRIFRSHRDNPRRAMAVLATPVTNPGDAVEQLASRQEIVSNPNLMEVVTELYFDATTGKLKRGSGSKGPGTPRRFAKDVLQQFDLTWDFYGMEPIKILRLLPAEFDRFVRSR